MELVSTDFDGTLVRDGAPVDKQLVECLAGLRSQGVHWAINTGRSLHHISEGLREHAFPFSPDYVLTNEREVFRRSPDHDERQHTGWEDFGEWNERCANDHDRAFELAGEFFKKVRSFAIEHGRLHILDYGGGALEGIVAESDDAMSEMVEYLEGVRESYPEVSYQRNSIYLRFCHIAYHKGSALNELRRLLGITRESTFAIGDNHNDIPMLDGSCAAMTACPGNALAEVKETVRQSGGYVARHHTGAGVFEAIQFFLNGRGSL